MFNCLAGSHAASAKFHLWKCASILTKEQVCLENYLLHVLSVQPVGLTADEDSLVAYSGK